MLLKSLNPIRRIKELAQELCRALEQRDQALRDKQRLESENARLREEIERLQKELDSYLRLIALMKPEMVPFPDQAEVMAGRHLIRHAADVPVLLSAIASRPDWLITHNIKHFMPAVARRTGLRIGTPVKFFRALSNSLSNLRRRANPPS